MNANRITPGHLAALLSILNSQFSTAFAQGSLTPPGAPGPTMKTLAQIEPRTPISSAPFTITNAGSYYLTANLTVSTGNAITIAANGVTLDLGGFTISSTAAGATGQGIRLNSGLRNLTILNGFIQGGVTNNAGTYNGPGFQNGISYSGTASANVRVTGISVSGCLDYGINLNTGDSTVVESCTVRTVGGRGIIANSIKSSVAVYCGSDALYGSYVSDSRGHSGSGTGLYATTAQNCYGDSDSGTGLDAYTAHNCYGYSGSSTGLYATTAQNCYGDSDSGTGLDAYTAHNCYGYSRNGTGLSAYTALNCLGYSGGNGYGIYGVNITIGCQGDSASGTGLSAYIANSCVGSSVLATHKYNMP